MKDALIGLLEGISALGLFRIFLGAGLGAILGGLAFYFTPNIAAALKKPVDTTNAGTSVQQVGSGNIQNNYFAPAAEQPPAKPNVAFQKFALFWVQTEPDVYVLGVVAKIFNLDSKAYLIKGITIEKVQWQLIPRGGYVIQRYTQFGDRADIIEDNYLKPATEGYFKKLLPIRIAMKDQGGNVTPDFRFDSRWNVKFENATLAIVPDLYSPYEPYLSQAEWDDLLKPKSSIKFEDLHFKSIR